MSEEKIAILIDSGCDVPPAQVEEYHLFVAPLRIVFSDAEFFDGVNITSEEFYPRIKKEIPKTSLPSADAVLKAVEQIKEEGYNKLLIVTISSGLSGTWNMMQLLANNIKDLDIYVYDTKNIAIGSGFSAIQAAEYIREGMDWETLKQTLEARTFKSKVFYCVDTLENLQKGGRIGLVTAVLGSAFNIKPIISCNTDGVYYTHAKCRGRKAAIKKVLESAVEFAGDSKKYNLALIGSGPMGMTDAMALEEEVLKALPHSQMLVKGELGCSLGVHTGEGLVGVGVQILD